jgi:hypothetical protein
LRTSAGLPAIAAADARRSVAAVGFISARVA